MLVKIFIVNFLLQILNGCKSTNDSKVDCKCTSPDVQNQIANNLSSYIILEIGYGTTYDMDVGNISNIDKEQLTDIVNNIKSRITNLKDINVHCYGKIWKEEGTNDNNSITNSQVITELEKKNDKKVKLAVKEFFKVCNKFDGGDNNPQNINYWNLGIPYTSNFFKYPDCKICPPCQGQVQPEEPPQVVVTTT